MVDLPVTYSARQVDALMDSAKTLLPVTTAYIAFVAATAKYMFELHRPSVLRRIRALIVIFALALSALAAWIFAIASTVDSARAFQLATNAKVSVTVEDLDRSYFFAVKAQQVAVIFLFLSLAMYCTLVLRTFAQPDLHLPATPRDVDERAGRS